MAKTSPIANLVPLEMPPTRALFEGVADAWILSLSALDRPPRGLAGVFDWHLQGWISRSIQNGIFSGDEGECAYLPARHQGRTLHLLLAGRGSTISSQRLSPMTLKALQKNLISLGRNSWGASTQDLGEDNIHRIAQWLGQSFAEARVWTST
jgi:hypothetical protein